MIIGILQFELLIHGTESLKDKRRVVKSLKDQLQSRFNCAVAETAHQDEGDQRRQGQHQGDGQCRPDIAEKQHQEHDDQRRSFEQRG